MNNRELLEYAAKAVGVELTPMEVKNVTKRGDDQFIGYMTNPEQWQRGWFNPLTDDGDALRLAVKLGIEVAARHNQSRADSIGLPVVYEPHCEDPYAATRRVIVRAAAEIGKEQA